MRRTSHALTFHFLLVIPISRSQPLILVMATGCDCLLKEISFGSRFIRAPAKQIYTNRRVFRVQVPAGPLNWFLPWVPDAIRSRIERMLPNWCLPRTIIIKEPDPSRAYQYFNEVQIYKQLKGLQGECIPRLFGEVASDNVPAMVLEYIEGIPLDQLCLEDLASSHALSAGTSSGKPRFEELVNPELLSALRVMYSQLTSYGVVHGDPKLHNFIRASGDNTKNIKVVAIDFGLSYPLGADSITNEDELGDIISLIANKAVPSSAIKEEITADTDPPQLVSMLERARQCWYGLKA